MKFHFFVLLKFNDIDDYAVHNFEHFRLPIFLKKITVAFLFACRTVIFREKGRYGKWVGCLTANLLAALSTFLFFDIISFLHVIEYTKRPSTSNALLNSNSVYGRNRFPTSLYKLIADIYEHSK